MIRTNKKWLLVLAGIICILYLLKQANMLPSFKHLFTEKPVLIDETPILIKDIKQLSELVTIASFDEMVIDSVKYSEPGTLQKLLQYSMPLPAPGYTTSQLVLIAKGKVMAGTNLKNLQPGNVIVADDSVALMLPPAEILDVIMNPSDITTFSETGHWTPDEITQVKTRAKNKLEQRALQQQILTKANQRAVVVMENFLRSVGFQKVLVRTL
jgi:hypothetical protein